MPLKNKKVDGYGSSLAVVIEVNDDSRAICELINTYKTNKFCITAHKDKKGTIFFKQLPEDIYDQLKLCMLANWIIPNTTNVNKEEDKQKYFENLLPHIGLKRPVYIYQKYNNLHSSLPADIFVNRSKENGLCIVVLSICSHMCYDIDLYSVIDILPPSSPLKPERERLEDEDFFKEGFLTEDKKFTVNTAHLMTAERKLPSMFPVHSAFWELDSRDIVNVINFSPLKENGEDKSVLLITEELDMFREAYYPLKEKDKVVGILSRDEAEILSSISKPGGGIPFDKHRYFDLFGLAGNDKNKELERLIEIVNCYDYVSLSVGDKYTNEWLVCEIKNRTNKDVLINDLFLGICVLGQIS